MLNDQPRTSLLEDSDEGYRALNSMSSPALAENCGQQSVLYKGFCGPGGSLVSLAAPQTLCAGLSPLAPGLNLNAAFPLSSYKDLSQASKSAPERKSSGLGASLYGSPSVAPLAKIWLFVASGGYPQFKDHPDPELKNWVIGSASLDVRKIHGIGNEFEGPIERCYFFDHAKYPPATASNVLEGLKQRLSEVSGFIYIALHRYPGEQPGFIATDCPEEPGAGSEYVIRDVEIRSIILASLKPGTKPLFLLTEACNTDNFMELPYFLECVNGIVKYGEFEECKKHDWSSRPPVAHMSATTPDHEAVHLKAGAVFTQAFNNMFRKSVNLEELVKVLQAAVDEHLHKIHAKGNNKTPLQQQIRLYYSTPGALQADTLWSFVNLGLKPSNQEVV